jgi:hypothetical protein
LAGLPSSATPLDLAAPALPGDTEAGKALDTGLSSYALSISQADVDLAEFAALRAEIVGHHSAQTTLVSVCLTAIGVVIGLVLSDKGAPLELLLVVPLISSGLGLFYASHSRICLIIGRYIRVTLWPRLRTGESLSWEEHLLSLRRENNPRSLRHSSLQFLGATVVFVMPSIGALAFSAEAAFARGSLELVWILGLLLLLLHVSLALGLAGEFRAKTDGSGVPDRAPAAAPSGPAGL